MSSRRAVSVASVLLLLAALALPAAASPAQVEQVWIVTLADGHPSGQNAAPLARRAGGSVWHVYETAINGFSFVGTDTAASNLARSPLVQTIERDRPVQAAGDVTPAGVQRIAAPAAHTAGYDGSGMKIAILDTGIDHTYPALSVDTSLGLDCMDPGSPKSGATGDAHGHGTHVAGTASAAGGGLVGAATAATLVPVKVLGDDGRGSTATIICGVDHVTANAEMIQVANMSLSGSGSAGAACGSPDAQALREAICRSVDAGVVHVVAAGNASTDVANAYPAAYPEVITVSALQEERCIREVGGGPARTTCGDGIASFSNYGEGVDVTAPGVGVYSSLTGGGFGTKSGTSMVAPHVAGVVALIRSANPGLNPAEVVDLLQSTGECPDGAVNGASGPCSGRGAWIGDPDSFTEPLVNAARAASAAGDPPSGTPEDDDTPVDDGPGDDTPGDDDPVDEDPPAQGITLEVSPYKVKGLHKADLSWSGTTSTSTHVDVVRDGSTVAEKVADSGSYTDHIDNKGGGSYTYKVCEASSDEAGTDEAGTQICSEEVTASF